MIAGRLWKQSALSSVLSIAADPSTSYLCWNQRAPGYTNPTSSYIDTTWHEAQNTLRAQVKDFLKLLLLLLAVSVRHRVVKSKEWLNVERERERSWISQEIRSVLASRVMTIAKSSVSSRCFFPEVLKRCLEHRNKRTQSGHGSNVKCKFHTSPISPTRNSKVHVQHVQSQTIHAGSANSYPLKYSCRARKNLDSSDWSA